MVLLFTPWFIVLGITNGVLPRIRLWISFVKKSISRFRSKDSIDIPLQAQFRPQWAGYHIPKTKLMNVLNIEHVLLNVVEHMHHEDVVNLSLACRAVREAVYPSNDLQYRLPKLHKYCKSIYLLSIFYSIAQLQANHQIQAAASPPPSTVSTATTKSAPPASNLHFTPAYPAAATPNASPTAKPVTTTSSQNGTAVTLCAPVNATVQTAVTSSSSAAAPA